MNRSPRSRIGMRNQAGDQVDGRREPALSSGPVDVAAEFVALTLRIVGRALLGIELKDEAPRIGAAVTTSLEYLERRVNSFVPVPLAIPTPRNLHARRAIRFLDGLIQRIGQERREPCHDSSDLLAMLLASRDEETGERLSDREARDQVLTMIGAGHETTAVALA